MIGRTNANNVDLNRDFPDLDRIVYSSEGTQREYNNHLMEYVKHLDHKIQPETESVMKMIMENPFVVRSYLALHATSLALKFKSSLGRPGVCVCVCYLAQQSH